MKSENEQIEQTSENVCLVCGNDIIPLSQPAELVCSFCGKSSIATEVCIENHFVCDECSHLDAKQIVKAICLKSDKTDPIDLAKEIMASPAIRMHGPEHHFITPAVLLTAMANLMGEKQNLSQNIELAENLAIKVAPTCSWHLGTCGAALGASIFVMIWRKLDPAKSSSWDEGNIIVANSLKRIAQLGSPRCCKRDTYIAIEETIAYLREKYNIDLPVSEAKCDFSLRNRSCKREDCIYFNLKFALV
ncbi:MAG: DUF5714 domain-containing protein [Candidatus Kapaibacteriota bacterium]|jgi:predicted RNA-binding Zn-ribbon protein involved in translation (DUF1610 family)